MKSKKLLAFLTATMMVASGAAMVAFAAEGDPAPTDPGTTDTGSTTGSSATIYDGYYVSQGGTWTFDSIANAGVKILTIASAIGTEPVTDFTLAGIADASDLTAFKASANSAYFAAKGVALTRFTTKKDKDNKEYKEYALIAYPNAGPKTFTITKDIVLIGDHGQGEFNSGEQGVVDADTNPFKYAPAGLVLSIPADHPTFVVGPKGLYTYTTQPGEITEKNGVWVAGPDKKVLKDLVLEADGKKLIVKAVGAGTTDPGTTDPTPNPNPGTDTNPATGSAGVGVALAALLATGSTAVVLKKRSR
ncbi:hypothetical protein FACS1894132_06500 [Clostridia bacterium]|nr:hypothetical protein FACS1894132_06500 [Clostridia bacterium]